MVEELSYGNFGILLNSLFSVPCILRVLRLVIVFIFTFVFGSSFPVIFFQYRVMLSFVVKLGYNY